MYTLKVINTLLHNYPFVGTFEYAMLNKLNDKGYYITQNL
jgi:hypothetical protein